MAKLTLAVPSTDTDGVEQTYNGGWATVSYRVTSGTGTATLQVSFDGGTTWETVVDQDGSNVAFTATGHKQIAYAGPCDLRVSVSGSSSLVATLDVIFGTASTQPRVRTG